MFAALRAEADPDVVNPAFFRLLVPGWFQIHAGRRTTGRAYLIGALISIFMTIVYFGSGAGAIWLGLVWAIHAGSIYDAIRMSSRDISENLSRLLCYGFVIGCALYLPLYAFACHYTIPITLHQSLGPLQQGDVVLYGQYSLRPPRAGDVVVYRIREVTIRRPGRNIAVQGLRVDRILAEPGQTVSCEQSRLMVDGIQSSLAPLAGPMPDISVTRVPADHVFIISSAELGQNGIVTDPQLALVPLDRILGQVYWKHLPWSRMGFVQ